MASAAKYLSKQAVSKHIAALAKGVESLSTNLSIIALIGLALVPMLPDRAEPALAVHAARLNAPPASFVSPAPPVEVVRARPMPAPLPPEGMTSNLAPSGGTGAQQVQGVEREPHRAAAVLAAVSRERRRRGRVSRRPQHESGEAGKAALGHEAGELGKAAQKTAAAARVPVPPPDAKSDAGKAEPQEPDEWSDAEIIAALRNCLKSLAPLGAEIEIAPPMKKDKCGDAAPVLLKRVGQGASRVVFQPPPMINCAMAANLHSWVEKTLQPVAQETLGSSIVRIRGASGYACRTRNGTRVHSDRLSEHARANAVDIMGFVTADGRTIDVLDRWGPNVRDIRAEQERLAAERAAAQRTAKEAAEQARDAAREADKEAAAAARTAARAPAAKRAEAKAEAQRKKEEAQRRRKLADEKQEEARRLQPVRSAELSKAGYSRLGRDVEVPTPTTAAASKLSVEASFLRRLHQGACTLFGTVLGPDANEAHRNHFHFDLAPRRRRNYCE